jgi:NodT family efflux transporter outer membrane factor (OMF) lipoprotein
VGPDFAPPAAPDVSRYTKEPLAKHTASTDTAKGASQRFVQGREISAEWWRLFHSPGLNSLIQKSLERNPSLQSAIASLRAAKEAVYAQQGKYFPLVQGNLIPSRTQTPAQISPTPASGAQVFDLYTAQVLVSYTFDVWGANRRQVESLQALADFQKFQVEAAYLALTANVVVAAIQEASLRGQIDATMEIIAANKKMLGILKNQFTNGYASRNDVAIQEAALAQVEATLPPLRKALAIQRDLIAALAGVFPSQEPSEIFKLAGLTLPLDLPVSLPSQMVQQRPDVRSAEEQLHSAGALVGVATANMLPSLTLSASGGYTSTFFSHLFSQPNLGWSVAGGVLQPIFDGLTLLHLRRGAEATFEQAMWTYRGTVITAMQNVADSLRAVQNDAEALKAARDFERAAKVSLDLAQQQMQTGNANILVLLTAQVTYQQARLQVVQAQASRLSDAAALFAALGGGWWNRLEPPPEQKLDIATTQITPLADKHN